MQLAYDIYQSVQTLPPEWDKHLPEGHALLKQNIATVELSQISDVQSLYVLCKENNQIVFCAYYQILRVKPYHFACQNKLQQRSLQIALFALRPTLLVAGHLFRHDAKFHHFVSQELPAKKKEEHYIQTTEFVLNKYRLTGVFLKDVPTEIANYILLKDHYKQMTEDVSMYINIPSSWSSMIDYQQALKHKYLQRYKKIEKQLDVIQVKELSLEDIIQNNNIIESLYLQVANHQIVRMGKLNAAFFTEMKKSMMEDYIVYGWFLENKMVAFSSAIIKQDTYDMNYIGFDYTINQSHAIYFNILFHCLQQAIRTQKSKLILGRTALEAKAILGCEPQYEYSFYTLRHPIVRWFYKRVAKGFREQVGEKWKDRHPFKSEFYKKSS
ncbi:MAG: hypothetical protein R2831_03370 [Chitinophagaceae bacterium]